MRYPSRYALILSIAIWISRLNRLLSSIDCSPSSLSHPPIVISLGLPVWVRVAYVCAVCVCICVCRLFIPLSIRSIEIDGLMQKKVFCNLSLFHSPAMGSFHVKFSSFLLLLFFFVCRWHITFPRNQISESNEIASFDHHRSKWKKLIITYYPSISAMHTPIDRGTVTRQWQCNTQARSTKQAHCTVCDWIKLNSIRIVIRITWDLGYIMWAL